MKYFLTGILKLLIGTALLYCISLILIYHTNSAKYFPNVLDKSKNDGFLLSRLRDLPNFKNVDLLFLGSSHACREFDPRIFDKYGYSSFNLGSSAQTPINSYYLLNKYYSSVKPKHVIFEIYFQFFERDASESSIDILSNSEIDLFNLKLALSNPNLKSTNSILSVIINRTIQPLHKIKEHKLPNDKYIKGGYVEKLLNGLTIQKPVVGKTYRSIKIRKDQINALIDLIDLCNSNDIMLTLVTAPITKELLAGITNYEDFHTTIENIASMHGIKYIDYNLADDIQFEASIDFYDSNHLNQSGVVRFNEHFILNYLNAE